MMKSDERYFTLGGSASGTIAARADQQKRLDEITDRLRGDEFFIATNDVIPSGCIDGRLGATLKPNTSGGTESMMVADDLTTQRFTGDSTTLEAYRNTLAYFKAHALPIGGHTAEKVADDRSGCGANDTLAACYAAIAAHGDEMRTLAESLGINIDAATHEVIVERAASRHDFSEPHRLLAVLREYAAAGEATLDVLRGSHNEVVTVLNRRPGTTLDREALAREFGEAYEAFNVDVWTFPEVAARLTNDRQEQTAYIAALLYYNFAVAFVLCAPVMRVVVRG